MEATERRKLTTKDMAGVESEREALKHSPQNPRSLEKTEDLNRTNGEELVPLLSPNDGNNFRSRWRDIQTSFVDEPRRAVAQADELVAEIMQNLVKSFSEQRNRLESVWEHSEKVGVWGNPRVFSVRGRAEQIGGNLDHVVRSSGVVFGFLSVSEKRNLASILLGPNPESGYLAGPALAGLA